jgi:flavodoxin I
LFYYQNYMQKIGLFYGTSTGSTAQAAKKIQSYLGAENVDIFNIQSATKKDIEKYKNLIFGTSSWGIGDLQEDWANFAPQFNDINLEGKTVALYGLGDQETYFDSFVDAMGKLYKIVQHRGATIVGEWSKVGYDFAASEALKDSETFVGLALDEDNQSELSNRRIERWAENLKAYFK